jgi:hypothetical protein
MNFVYKKDPDATGMLLASVLKVTTALASDELSLVSISYSL